MTSDPIRWQSLTSPEHRRTRLGQRPVIAWLTGLSGAGKTTIAVASDAALAARGYSSVILDGDNLRHGLNGDLGFTADDRTENIRRTAEVARLMAGAGLIAIVATISPRRADRARARVIAADIPFLEIFVDTPLTVCEARDPKGLYGRARFGEIPNFTGITAPYDAPETPDLRLATQTVSIGVCAGHVVDAILPHALIDPR